MKLKRISAIAIFLILLVPMFLVSVFSAINLNINISSSLNYVVDLPNFEIFSQRASWGTTYQFVEVGMYPQEYVGDDLNETLKLWYQTNNPVSVDEYTVYMSKVGEGTETYCEFNILYAYEYIDGNIYVRMPETNSAKYFVGSLGQGQNRILDEELQHIDGTIDYMSGDELIDEVEAWFKVQPIKWRILTQNYNGQNISYLMSELLLSSSCFYFDYDADSASYYENSNNYLKKYLEYFYQDAFTDYEKSLIVGRNFSLSDLDTTSSSSEIVLSDQKVWSPTYNDLNNTSYGFPEDTSYPGNLEDFGKNYSLHKSASDFTMANNTRVYKCVRFPTIDREEGYDSSYYTISRSGNNVYIADMGFVSVGSYNSIMGVCPAILFNL